MFHNDLKSSIRKLSEFSYLSDIRQIQTILLKKEVTAGEYAQARKRLQQQLLASKNIDLSNALYATMIAVNAKCPIPTPRLTEDNEIYAGLSAEMLTLSSGHQFPAGELKHFDRTKPWINPFIQTHLDLRDRVFIIVAASKLNIPLSIPFEKDTDLRRNISPGELTRLACDPTYAILILTTPALLTLVDEHDLLTQIAKSTKNMLELFRDSSAATNLFSILSELIVPNSGDTALSEINRLATQFPLWSDETFAGLILKKVKRTENLLIRKVFVSKLPGEFEITDIEFKQPSILYSKWQKYRNLAEHELDPRFNKLSKEIYMECEELKSQNDSKKNAKALIVKLLDHHFYDALLSSNQDKFATVIDMYELYYASKVPARLHNFEFFQLIKDKWLTIKANHKSQPLIKYIDQFLEKSKQALFCDEPLFPTLEKLQHSIEITLGNQKTHTHQQFFSSQNSFEVIEACKKFCKELQNINTNKYISFQR